jgi:hypothetical protein
MVEVWEDARVGDARAGDDMVKAASTGIKCPGTNAEKGIVEFTWDRHLSRAYALEMANAQRVVTSTKQSEIICLDGVSCPSTADNEVRSTNIGSQSD